MEEDSQEGIISLVNSIFNVGEFTKTEFTLEFKIENLEFKTKMFRGTNNLFDFHYTISF